MIISWCSVLQHHRVLTGKLITLSKMLTGLMTLQKLCTVALLYFAISVMVMTLIKWPQSVYLIDPFILQFPSLGKPAPPVKRELLRHRDYKVDLESKLGKTIVITKTTPQAEMGGWVTYVHLHIYLDFCSMNKCAFSRSHPDVPPITIDMVINGLYKV